MTPNITNENISVVKKHIWGNLNKMMIDKNSTKMNQKVWKQNLNIGLNKLWSGFGTMLES